MNTISQLKTSSDGYGSSGVEGTLSDVYDINSFTGKNGKSNSVQKAFLQDSSGEKIKLAFWGFPDWSLNKGKFVRLLPKKTPKGDRGLLVRDNEYQGKTSKELHVYTEAQISWDEPPTKPKDIQEDDPLGEVFEGDTEGQMSIDGDAPKSEIDHLPSSLIQSVNCMDICIEAANYLRNKWDDMPDEVFNTLHTAFFIECNRQGLSKSMPNRPFPK